MNVTAPANSETTFVFQINVWITNLVFHILLLAFSIYMITALIYHEVKVEKKRERFVEASTEKKYAMLSKLVCIFIGFMSLLRNLNSIGFLWMEIIAISKNSTFDEDLKLACQILPQSGNIILTLGLGFVYCFLWLRQRVFYIHPSLKVLNNLTTRILSSATAISWLIFFVSLFISYIIVVQYDLQAGGGCLVRKSIIYSYLAIILTWGVVSLLIQIALLGLFIYPIMKKVSWTDKNLDQTSVLIKRVKKAVYLTLTCLVSDIMSAALPTALFKENENFLFFFYSINLAVNHVVTVACFDHWKDLIWPWNVNKNKIAMTKKSESGNSAVREQSNDKKTISTTSNTCIQSSSRSIDKIAIKQS